MKRYKFRLLFKEKDLIVDWSSLDNVIEYLRVGLKYNQAEPSELSIEKMEYDDSETSYEAAIKSAIDNLLKVLLLYDRLHKNIEQQLTALQTQCAEGI